MLFSISRSAKESWLVDLFQTLNQIPQLVVSGGDLKKTNSSDFQRHPKQDRTGSFNRWVHLSVLF